MARKDVSAGLLVYRKRRDAIEMLLAHPGGPFWARKDNDAWTIPKGLVEGGDELLATARREFTEETGFIAAGPFTPLEPVKQSSGKVVHAFVCEGDFDPAKLTSNTFNMEWPPRSRQQKEFPEIDRVGWFGLDEAMTKLIAYQRPWIAQLRGLITR